MCNSTPCEGTESLKHGVVTAGKSTRSLAYTSSDEEILLRWGAIPKVLHKAMDDRSEQSSPLTSTKSE